MGQLFLRPDADQSDGSWLNEASSGTNLFASVDESSLNDSDYIQSSTTIGDKVRLRLSDPGTTVSQPFIIRYRCKRGSGSATAGVTVRLFQGTTKIAEKLTQIDDTLTTYTYTLTSGEFTSITDFNDLYVEFEYSEIWWRSGAAIDLDFKNNRYYDSSVGPGVAVTSYLSTTRASNGYGKNADGTLTPFSSTVLRITNLGLLVEDDRTNQVLRSQEFNDAAWTKANGSITADAVAAPDGTTTGDLFTPNTTNAGHRVIQSFGGSGNPQPYGVYVKAAGYGFACLTAIADAQRHSIVVNLTTGAITSTDTSGAPTINLTETESYTNGWWLIQIVLNSGGTTAQLAVSASNSATPSFDANGTPSFAGDGTSGIYIWGAQSATNRQHVGSYVPTTGSTANRATDSIPCSGALDTLLRATTASVVVTTGPLYGWVDGQNRMPWGTSGLTNTVYYYGVSGISIRTYNGAADLSATNLSSGTWDTIDVTSALGWASAARSITANGGTVQVDTSTVSSGAQSYVGTYDGSNGLIKGYLQRITVWNSKLADATLQALSTPP